VRHGASAKFASSVRNIAQKIKGMGQRWHLLKQLSGLICRTEGNFGIA
jgi:hypothetical protein